MAKFKGQSWQLVVHVSMAALGWHVLSGTDWLESGMSGVHPPPPVQQQSALESTFKVQAEQVKFKVGDRLHVKRSNGQESIGVLEEFSRDRGLGERILYTVLLDASTGLRKRVTSEHLRPAETDPLRMELVEKYALCKGGTAAETLAAADARGISTEDLQKHVTSKMQQREKLLEMLGSCIEDVDDLTEASGWTNQVRAGRVRRHAKRRRCV